MKLSLCTTTLIAVYFLAIFGLVDAQETKTEDGNTNGYGVEKDFRINFVLRVENNPTRMRAKITTKPLGTLWLDAHNVDDYEDDLKMIILAMRKKEPLQIRYSMETRIIEFLTWAYIDWIPYVQESQHEYIEVRALMRPSSLRLYKNNSRFDELYNRLLLAQANYSAKGMTGTKAIIANDEESIEDVLFKED